MVRYPGNNVLGDVDIHGNAYQPRNIDRKEKLEPLSYRIIEVQKPES
jgi:hypothetical protein